MRIILQQIALGGDYIIIIKFFEGTVSNQLMWGIIRFGMTILMLNQKKQ